MSTKLYTEESIKQKLSRMNFFLDEQIEDFIDDLTPIELPSDEEINNEWEVGYSDYKNGCNYGAKWMRDKIQGGNK